MYRYDEIPLICTPTCRSTEVRCFPAGPPFKGGSTCSQLQRRRGFRKSGSALSLELRCDPVSRRHRIELGKSSVRKFLHLALTACRIAKGFNQDAQAYKSLHAAYHRNW